MKELGLEAAIDADITAEISAETGAAANFAQQLARLERALRRVVRSSSPAVRLALVAVLADGHLLIEDVPGVGKTTLAQALAHVLDCRYQRIQFTSDLLPSDVIGVSIYNQACERFEFNPGPVFTNLLLAD
ncbi:MAG: AAA family ATPase, partial [Terriglobales bacterium]